MDEEIKFDYSKCVVVMCNVSLVECVKLPCFLIHEFRLNNVLFLFFATGVTVGAPMTRTLKSVKAYWCAYVSLESPWKRVVL